jgi:hypothetical protein
MSSNNCIIYLIYVVLGIPSSRYVETCMTGYDDFGFDKALLQDAVKRSWEGSGWEAL